MTFTYTDRDGDKLTIEPCGDSAETVYLETGGTHVPAADLPEIVAELYKAAGQDPPVVHEHIDDEGAGLSIKSSEFRPSTAFVESCIGVYVTPEDLSGLVRKLYEAAGQEPPILLPRPAVEDLRAHGWVDGNEVNSPIPSGKIPPGVARNWAAWLAASADIAEAEPDPEQVKQLAALIEEHAGWDSADLAARAVLRAGYVRGEA